MSKVYLASGISDKARKTYQAGVVDKLVELGYEVYGASKNDSINDKSNDPTPADIYNGDIPRVLESDYVVVAISGAGEDGTISEIGAVTGWNEYEYLQKIKLNKQYEPYKPIKIVAYLTNERLLQPQFYIGKTGAKIGVPSAGYNHLVLAMIDKWGVLLESEDAMLEYMKNEL